MKRIGYGLILVLLSMVGCTPGFSFFRDEQKPPQVEIKPKPAPPVVTPDTVTETNAMDRAKALREELEHEARNSSGIER